MSPSNAERPADDQCQALDFNDLPADAPLCRELAAYLERMQIRHNNFDEDSFSGQSDNVDAARRTMRALRRAWAVAQRGEQVTDRQKQSVRFMLQCDIPEVMRVERDTHDCPLEKGHVSDMMRNMNAIGMVAEHGEQVTGDMIYALRQRYLSVLSIGVAASHRKHGVTEYLLAKLLTKLASGGRSRLEEQIGPTHTPDIGWIRAVLDNAGRKSLACSRRRLETLLRNMPASPLREALCAFLSPVFRGDDVDAFREAAAQSSRTLDILHYYAGQTGDSLRDDPEKALQGLAVRQLARDEATVVLPFITPLQFSRGRKLLRTVQKSPPDTAWFVAESDGTARGCAACETVNEGTTDARTYLHRFSVAPENAKRGVAGSLAAAVLRHMADKGVTAMGMREAWEVIEDEDDVLYAIIVTAFQFLSFPSDPEEEQALQKKIAASLEKLPPTSLGHGLRRVLATLLAPRTGRELQAQLNRAFAVLGALRTLAMEQNVAPFLREARETEAVTGDMAADEVALVEAFVQPLPVRPLSPDERKVFDPRWIRTTINGELAGVAEYHRDTQSQSVRVTRMSIHGEEPGRRSRAFDELAGALLARVDLRNPHATLQHAVPKAVKERDAE